MSTIPPAKQDIWDYENSQFFVTVQSQDKKPHRHRRATARELNALFHPSADQPPRADPTAHWYNAQCLHYGLKPSSVKGTAHKRLLEASNKEHLIVPSWIRKIERKLKREWDARVAESQSRSRREQRRADTDQSTRKSKKRRVSTNTTRDPEVIVIDNESPPVSPESVRHMSTTARVRSTGDPGTGKRKRDKTKEPTPRPGSILDTLPLLVRDAATPATESRKKRKRDRGERSGRDEERNGVTDIPGGLGASTSHSVALTQTATPRHQRKSATPVQRASPSPSPSSTSSASSSSSSESSDEDDLPLLPSRLELRSRRPPPPPAQPPQIPTIRATNVTPPHSPAVAPSGFLTAVHNRDSMSQRSAPAPAAGSARNTMRVPHPKTNTRPLPNGAPSHNDPNRLRKSMNGNTGVPSAPSSSAPLPVTGQPARNSFQNAIPPNGSTSKAVQFGSRPNHTAISVHNRSNANSVIHPLPQKPQASAVQPATPDLLSRSNAAKQLAHKAQQTPQQATTSRPDTRPPANSASGVRRPEAAGSTTPTANARLRKDLLELDPSSTVSGEAIAAMARFREQASSAHQKGLSNDQPRQNLARNIGASSAQQATNETSREPPHREAPVLVQQSSSVTKRVTTQIPAQAPIQAPSSTANGTDSAASQTAGHKNQNELDSQAFASVQQASRVPPGAMNGSSTRMPTATNRSQTSLHTPAPIPEGALVFRPANIKLEPVETNTVTSASPAIERRDAPETSNPRIKTEPGPDAPVPQIAGIDAAATGHNGNGSNRPKVISNQPQSMERSRSLSNPSSLRDRGPQNPSRRIESDVYRPNYRRSPSPRRMASANPARPPPRFDRDRRPPPVESIPPSSDFRRGPDQRPSYGRPLLDSWTPSYSSSSYGDMRPSASSSSRYNRPPSPYSRYRDDYRGQPPFKSLQWRRAYVDMKKPYSPSHSPCLGHSESHEPHTPSKHEGTSRPSTVRRGSGVNNPSPTQNQDQPLPPSTLAVSHPTCESSTRTDKPSHSPSPPLPSAGSRPVDGSESRLDATSTSNHVSPEQRTATNPHPQLPRDTAQTSKDVSKEKTALPSKIHNPSTVRPQIHDNTANQNASGEKGADGIRVLSSHSEKEHQEQGPQAVKPQTGLQDSSSRSDGLKPQSHQASVSNRPRADSHEVRQHQLLSSKQHETLPKASTGSKNQNAVSDSSPRGTSCPQPQTTQAPSPQPSLRTEGSAIMDISPIATPSSITTGSLVRRPIVRDKVVGSDGPLRPLQDTAMTDAVFNGNIDEPVQEGEVSNTVKDAAAVAPKTLTKPDVPSASNPSLGEVQERSSNIVSKVSKGRPDNQRPICSKDRQIDPPQHTVNQKGGSAKETAVSSSALEPSTRLSNRISSPSQTLGSRAAAPDTSTPVKSHDLPPNAKSQKPALFLSGVDSLGAARSFFNSSENAAIKKVEWWGKWNVVCTFSTLEDARKAYNHQPKIRKTPRRPGEPRSVKVQWFEERPLRRLQPKSSYEAIQSEGRDHESRRHMPNSSIATKSIDDSGRASVEPKLPPAIGGHIVQLPGSIQGPSRTPSDSTKGAHPRSSDALPHKNSFSVSQSGVVSDHGMALPVHARVGGSELEQAKGTPPARIHIRFADSQSESQSSDDKSPQPAVENQSHPGSDIQPESYGISIRGQASAPQPDVSRPPVLSHIPSWNAGFDAIQPPTLQGFDLHRSHTYISGHSIAGSRPPAILNRWRERSQFKESASDKLSHTSYDIKREPLGSDGPSVMDIPIKGAADRERWHTVQSDNVSMRENRHQSRF